MDSYLLNCKYGKANLVLTNFQMMIENSKGVILAVGYGDIMDLRLIDSKSIKISWMEGVNLCQFTFKSDRAYKIAYDYAAIKQNLAS